MRPAESRDPARTLHRIATTAAGAALVALLLPFLIHALAKIPRATPLDYNEGWNAYHAARLRRGEPLYPPTGGLPVTPVNYPPLSFLIFGGLSRLGAPPVHTGRLVSLASLLGVTWIVFRTIVALTADRRAATLAALLWLGLLVRFAPAFVGSYDPQMLGHVFCAAAFLFYSAWREDLARRRVAFLAVLCSVAIFVKHLLLAVPLALAIAVFVENRRLLPPFAAAGLLISAALAVCTRLLGGEHVIANLLAFERATDNQRLSDEIQTVFLKSGAATLFLPFLALVWRRERKETAAVAYFAVSCLLGACAVRGIGVDRNAWFDFFIAASLAFGLLAAATAHLQEPRARILASAVLASCVFPVAAHFGTGLREAFSYGKIAREEEAYLEDVELLRGVAGPALFEDPLLGFDAGKDLLFDPFTGSQMIASGRLPESVLTDAVQRKKFAVIVLTSDVERSLGRRRPGGAPPPDRRPHLIGWWTRRTLEAVRDAYEPFDPGRRRYGHFYFPRKP